MGERGKTEFLEIMMESSIVSLHEIKNDNQGFRIDAEHYRKQYLLVRDKLINRGSILLENCIRQRVITGHTPSMKNEKYYNGSINFIKTDNVRENEITADFIDKLTVEGNNRIKRSSLKENDVIATIIGASHDIVGRAALVQKKDLPGNINQNIALIRTSEDILPAFLTVYLNSYYGRNCLWYLSRQTEQVNLNCREVEQLLVPNISHAFQNVIVEIYDKTSSLGMESSDLYIEAEQVLLSEICLLNWKPKYQLSFVKNFSDTKSTNRIDADYFQPVYDEMVKAVKSAKSYARLGDLVSIKKCVEPGSEAYQDSGVPFVRVSNLSKSGINDNNQQFISESLYESLRMHQPHKGEILLSKDATPGIAYYMRDMPGKMIPSAGYCGLG